MRLYLAAGMLLLSLVVVATSCGGDDSGDGSTNSEAAPSSSTSPTVTTAPIQIDEPESNSKNRAERGLLQLSDLPSGFFDQGTEISGTSETNPSLLALATRSFGRQPTSSEALGGAIISLGAIVLVMSDEDEAQSRMEPGFLEASASATAESVYGVTNPETREISFTPLGDDSAAVELVGTGTLAGQRVELVFRTIGVRQSNIGGVLNIVGLKLGSISEVEDLAAKFADRLEDAAN